MMIDQIQKSQLVKVGLFAVAVTTIGLIYFISGEKASKHEMKFGSDAPEERLSGGLGDLREPDDEVKEAVAAVKEELETKTGKQYKSLDVIKHRVQVVAGLNFFAKVKAIDSEGKESLLHLRIYRTLSNKFELTAFQQDKSLSDEIVHFEP